MPSLDSTACSALNPVMDNNAWNERYAGKELLWSATPNIFLTQEIAGIPKGRALDLGCGEGRNAIWLAEQGFSVDAVDFSEVAIERAKTWSAERGVQVSWAVEDLLTYEPKPSGYDLVALLYLHLPWAQMQVVLPRAAQAVAPGGTFLLIGHDLSNPEHGHGGPPAPVLYTADQVAAELHDFDIGVAETRERVVEGAPRAALDCVVRATRT